MWIIFAEWMHKMELNTFILLNINSKDRRERIKGIQFLVMKVIYLTNNNHNKNKNCDLIERLKV